MRQMLPILFTAKVGYQEGKIEGRNGKEGRRKDAGNDKETRERGSKGRKEEEGEKKEWKKWWGREERRVG